MRQIFILLFAVLPVLAFGQTKRAYEKNAAKYLEKKDYFGAMRNFQKAVELDSMKLPNIIGAADAARKFTAFSIAEKYYKQALIVDTTNTTDALFWLGYVENSQGKYKEANAHFQDWVSLHTPEDTLFQGAKMYLEYNGWAIANQVSSNTENVTNLGDTINSPESDFAAVKVGDDIYFSSLRFLNKKDKANPKRYYSKLMVAKKGGEPQKLEAPFNIAPDKHVGNLVFDASQSVGYFTICDYTDGGTIDCKIYLTEKQSDGSWGEAHLLSDEINAPGANVTHPMLAYDGDKTYFYYASNQKTGKGGMDIWRAEIVGKNQFSSIENLESINTPLDEVTPFYDPISQSLFFSSNGYMGYGLFDIFKVSKKDNGWGTVENLKKPTNSSYNDTYYRLLDGGKKAYLASNRPSSSFIDDETETCCNDIYEVDIPLFVRLIVNTINKLDDDVLNGTQVQLLNLTDNTIDTVALVVDENRYFFPLELNKEYKLIGKHSGFVGDEVLVSTMNLTSSKAIEKDLLLIPKINFLAMTFDKVTATLLPKAGVRLIDLTDGHKEQKVNDQSNEFAFEIDVDRDYMVIAYRESFSTDTLKFTTKGYVSDGKPILKKLYLEKQEGIYATLPIYFHNDEPNPNTISTKATSSYEDSFRRYMKLRTEYKTSYASGLSGQEKEKAYKEVDRFFDKEVVRGYQSLIRFADRLKKYMLEGKSADIVIKGFASPLATDSYNMNLTKRRIDNTQRFLEIQNDGFLKPYFDNNKIRVKVLPYGEARSPIGISDSPDNPNAAIYSPRVARERRVEILQLNSFPKKTL